jgi:hypothetical protein
MFVVVIKFINWLGHLFLSDEGAVVQRCAPEYRPEQPHCTGMKRTIRTFLIASTLLVNIRHAHLECLHHTTTLLPSRA